MTKGDLRQEVALLHREISLVNKEVVSQTKWMVSCIFGVAARCMTAAKLWF